MSNVYETLMLKYQFTDRGGREVYNVYAQEEGDTLWDGPLGRLRLDISDVGIRTSTMAFEEVPEEAEEIPEGEGPECLM